MYNKNLLDQVHWTSWSPRKELTPVFFTGKDYDGNSKIGIASGTNPNIYGKWISNGIFIPGSYAILFEVLFSQQGVKNEEKSIFAIISMYNREGVILERDHAEILHSDDGKLKKLYKKLNIPEDTASVKIEIGVRWCPGATVEWSGATLRIVEKEPERLVRIATTYKEPCDTMVQNLESMVNIINKACRENPDVILMSELVHESYINLPLEKKSQSVPGPLTDKIGEYAKKHNTYIIFTMNEREGDLIYNTAVIIGRNGSVCGKYRKVHLPLAEAEEGVSPGDEPGIFDLDFGRIGIITCYDQMFPESSRTLALMGAELIFLPTMGEEETLQKAIARSNGVHVVVSGYAGAKSSRIINPQGEIIASVQDERRSYVLEQIDLNKRFFTYYMSIGPGNGETKMLFQKERMIETYHAVTKESYKLKG